MSKIRVHEYAKKHNISSKDLMTKLKEMNIEVSNHMTMLDDEVVNKLDNEYQAEKPSVADEFEVEEKVVRSKKNSNKKKKKGKGNEDKRQENFAGRQQTQTVETPDKITFSGSLTVGDLAKKLSKEPSEIIKKLFMLGIMATINQDLDKDTIELIANDYGIEVEEEVIVSETEFETFIDEQDDEENLKERPAVVTIMGHVDHGKTTLLDSIRNSKVTAGEAGGITQHIGAYQVEVNDKKITFLDTPGHAAFTTMRARGAQVTDITILVVAADDGVMPQTVEAINHAKAAGVPIIVAVNKMDKPAANPDRVMQELTEYELVPEAWGGDTIFVPISAIQGEGIDTTPVEITGLNEVPQAGDRFMAFADEKKARQIGESRAQEALLAQRGEKSKLSLEDLFQQIQEGDVKEINLIVKADVQGSVEAMAASLRKIDVEGVKVKIIHTGVGAITESDIILASASNAIVIGFNVRPDVNAKRTAELENVDIRLHRIIYKVIEEIEAAMQGMLDPEFEEKVIGQAEVRQTFKVTKVGTIAGCYVTDGKITRDSGVRIIRDGVVIFEGQLDTLKRFKDDVKEVAQNYECGITIERYNDLKEGDIIEAYIMEEVKR